VSGSCSRMVTEAKVMMNRVQTITQAATGARPWNVALAGSVVLCSNLARHGWSEDWCRVQL
jgi:hypothetical protein